MSPFTDWTSMVLSLLFLQAQISSKPSGRKSGNCNSVSGPFDWWDLSSDSNHGLHHSLCFKHPLRASGCCQGERVKDVSTYTVNGIVPCPFQIHYVELQPAEWSPVAIVPGTPYISRRNWRASSDLWGLLGRRRDGVERINEHWSYKSKDYKENGMGENKNEHLSPTEHP